MFIQQQVIPVLKGILCPALKFKFNLRPLLLAVAVQDYSKQLPVLLAVPRAFFDLGVKVAAPMLSTLLSSPEDFPLYAFLV